MSEPVSLLVATEDAPENWLHSADVVVAAAAGPDDALRLGAELLRRCPGCLLVCVRCTDRCWVLCWRSV